MKRGFRQLDEREVPSRFPITDRVEGWYFRVKETLPGDFLAEGTDLRGREVACRRPDADSALGRCIDDALAVTEASGRRRDFVRSLSRTGLRTLVVCATLVIAGLLWWWLGGGRTTLRLTNCFTIVGAISMVVGVGLISGRVFVPGRLRSATVQSEEWGSSHRLRSEEKKVQPEGLLSIFLALFAGGALTIGIGWLVYALAS